MGIISWIILGLIAGFIGSKIVDRQGQGFWLDIVLGIVGSFIGGFLGWALFGKDLDQGALQASGVIGSIVGAVIALLVYRAVTRRSARPGALRR